MELSQEILLGVSCKDIVEGWDWVALKRLKFLDLQ
jgi:hypothetical protein